MKKLIDIFIALLITLTVSSFIIDRPVEAATKPVVIFYSPHQDDELLTMGVAIKKHVQAGYEVHVVVLTDGSASKAITEVNNRLIRDHLTPLTLKQFIDARNTEFTRSCMALGVQKEHIHFGNLKDGKTTVTQVESIMIKYAKKFPNAKHRTMSYTDDHNDHMNAGKALLSFYRKGIARDVRFYIQKDEFDKQNPKIKYFTKENYQPSYYQNIKNAANSYMVWNPKQGYYAIGYTSVKQDFVDLLKAPISTYHRPGENM